MKKEGYWNLFIKTGHPIFYMAHKRSNDEREES